MLLHETKSVCFECKKTIPAEIIEEDNKIYLLKKCQRHGESKHIYWEDAAMYHKFNKYKQDGVHSTEYTKEKRGCPWDCGICNNHKSQTILCNIDVTNRCNLRCWYCFANANAAGYIYEPSFQQITEMMDLAANQKPARCIAVLLSGGEPTIRKDIVDIVGTAWRKGFMNTLLATNGVRIAEDPHLLEKLKAVNPNVVLYLKLNGLTPETNIENLDYIPKIIENCRRTGTIAVLVPTIINGFNDQEAFSIIEYAIQNLDVVRGVNFQPIAFSGRISQREIQGQRITIPELIKKIEQQSNDRIPAESFFPVPAITSFSSLAKKILGFEQPTLSCHPHCGAATYIFKGDEEIIPITEFIKVEEFFDYMMELAKKDDAKLSLFEKLNYLKTFGEIQKRFVIKKKKMPIGMDLIALLKRVLIDGRFDAFGEFPKNSLFIGTMHFQDQFNIDCDRTSRCVIHYATPDGRMIPFCSYNTLGIREEIEKRYAKPLEVSEIEKTH